MLDIQSSTKYFAVRQKSTGKYLPEVETRGGYTHTEPQPFKLVPPRLHMHAGSARRAKDAYCRGVHVRRSENVASYESFDPEYVESIDIKDGTARDPNDFEVVDVYLVEGDPTKDLSDGRPAHLIGETYARTTSPVYGNQVSPWGSNDKPEQDPG